MFGDSSLPIPKYEIVYYRKKVSEEKTKVARKEMLSEKGKAIQVMISIGIGFFLPFLFDFLRPEFPVQPILSVVGAILVYLLLSYLGFGISVPKGWALGNNGIYLSYFWRKCLTWEKMSLNFEWIEERKHGLLVKSKKFRLENNLYLVTNEREKVREIIWNFCPSWKDNYLYK
jgi:hypothetical protein